MKNVIVRALSGAVYVLLIVGCVLGGGYWWLGLALVFTLLGTLEYQKLMSRHSGHYTPWALRALDMAMALGVVCYSAVSLEYGASLRSLLLIISLYIVIRLSGALAQKEGNAMTDAMAAIFGVLYIALPLSLLSWGIMQVGVYTGAALLMFCLIWLNDTGAFCFGITLGKHRLCERLSPKKSWEGFWGGMLTCVAAAIITSYLTGLMPIWQSAIYGIIVSLASTWGDLFESLIKRTAGVKDAGNLIPGHGGILDRIDSLLFVAPATAAFMILFNLVV